MASQPTARLMWASGGSCTILLHAAWLFRDVKLKVAHACTVTSLV